MERNDKNVWNDIQNKWKEIIKLFDENYDKKKQTLKAELDHGNLPKLKLKNRENKAGKGGFIVRFNGKILKSKGGKGAASLVKFIEMIGVESVLALKITTAGNQFLVSDSNTDVDNQRYKSVGGKYVFIKTANSEKYTQISEIIKRLNLDATIEMVD